MTPSEAEIARLRLALEHIKTHQERLAGGKVARLTGAWSIADRALKQEHQEKL